MNNRVSRSVRPIAAGGKGENVWINHTRARMQCHWLRSWRANLRFARAFLTAATVQHMAGAAAHCLVKNDRTIPCVREALSVHAPPRIILNENIEHMWNAISCFFKCPNMKTGDRVSEHTAVPRAITATVFCFLHRPSATNFFSLSTPRTPFFFFPSNLNYLWINFVIPTPVQIARLNQFGCVFLELKQTRDCMPACN